jgi:hypothetical protein
MVFSLATTAFAGWDVSKYEDADKITQDEAVAVLSGLGIIEGDETTGTLNPDEPYTRAAAAKVLAYMLLGPENAEALPDTSSKFTDVETGKWYTGVINYLAEEGILSGYGDGTFGPDDDVTQDQWLKMLLCAMGYDEEKAGMGNTVNWAINARSLAIKKDLVTAAQLKLDWNRETAILNAYTAITLNKNLADKDDKDPVFAVTVDSAKTDVCSDKTTGTIDKFGRPTAKYQAAGAKDPYATYVADPDLTYEDQTVEVADIVKALGDDDAKFVTYEDGYAASTTPAAPTDKATVGHKGSTVEVYTIDAASHSYRIVVINTYAKKLVKADVVAATADAEAYIQVEGSAGAGRYETADYAEGDVILYTQTKNGSGTTAIVSVEKAESAEGKPTGSGNDGYAFVRIDGEKVYLSNGIVGEKNTNALIAALTNATLYFDTFGNIVYAQETSATVSERTVDGYVYLIAGQATDANELAGTEASAKYQILDLATGTKSVVNAAIVADAAGTVKYATKDGTAGNVEVSQTLSPAAGTFYGYYKLDDGSYVLESVTDESVSGGVQYVVKDMKQLGGSLETSFYVGSSTELTYVAKETYKVTTVVGNANFPTLTSTVDTTTTKISVVKNVKTNMIEKIFVFDATPSAEEVVSASSYGMYVKDGEYDKASDTQEYVFLVNGVETAVTGVKDLKFTKDLIYDLKTTNGKVASVVAVSEKNTGTMKAVEAIDSTYIKVADTEAINLAEGYQVVDLSTAKKGLFVGANVLTYYVSSTAVFIVVVD